MENTTEKQQLDTLVKAGSLMRKAQNAYFRSQSKQRLAEAKALENKFDRLISEMETENNTSIQTTLL